MKKIRGKKRKTKKLIEQIIKNTTVFPEEDYSGCGYWHVHLPCAQGFIDSEKTPTNIRIKCIQALVNAAKQLIEKRPDSVTAKVVVSICLPSLWDSQVIVFFSEDYYLNFFDRKSHDQEWRQIDNSNGIVKQFNIKLPNGFLEKCYNEIIREDDEEFHSKLVFIGELN